MTPTLPYKRPIAHGTLIACAGLLLALCWASPSLAAPPHLDEGPETCTLCHQAEVQAWQNSSHAGAASVIDHEIDWACPETDQDDCTCLDCHSSDFDPLVSDVEQAGVTCQACHGPYVKGHPDNGVMRLDVDSSVCSDCHIDTHADWQASAHGKAGVQCIGCHRAHPQDLRLANQYLCASCHREGLQDPGHVAHDAEGIDCVDCHVSPATSMASASGTAGAHVALSHQFVVNTEVCAECHGSTFHEDDKVAAAVLMASSQQPVEASGREKPSPSAEVSRRWIQGATLTALGLGMGIGGMMGIGFVLIVAYLSQRQKEVGS